MDDPSDTPADSAAATTPRAFCPAAAAAAYSATHAPSILRTANAAVPHALARSVPPHPHPDLLTTTHTGNDVVHHVHKQSDTAAQPLHPSSHPNHVASSSWTDKPPPQAPQPQLQSPTQPQQEAVSFHASEFIAFAVHRIWHRSSIKRRQTVPSRPPVAANPNTASPPATFSDTAPSPPDPALAHSSPASHPPQAKHQLPASAQPPLVPAPFCHVVCPPATNDWYPAFFEAVHRVLSRSGCTLPHVLIALLYVARLRQVVPEDLSGEGSEYRVFVSALVLAQKYHSDDRYSNKAWSKITKLPLTEINTMEREFLSSINGKLHVQDTEYAKWVEIIQVLGQEHSVALRVAAMNAQADASPSSTTPIGPFDPSASNLRRIQTVPRQVNA